MDRHAVPGWPAARKREAVLARIEAGFAVLRQKLESRSGVISATPIAPASTLADDLRQARPLAPRARVVPLAA